ncbi:hypothetical protein NJC40_03350 [Pseudomonas sp. 21LCFQ02]|uniref:hypothetical protein n=1 Tax=Pseudomonas sp. 21LCFQ02 TaxID=2957505 RepID=UPI00209A6B11|nr:hypothetical protein [Pseudomonas sp. 21LCFQ02]MCO8166813.1 hypothetical protein [Pseudomonas sp. 21LCFQ02]
MARSKEEIEELARIAAEQFMADLSATGAGGGDLKAVSRRHSSIHEELLSGWSSEDCIIFHRRYSDDVERLVDSPSEQPSGYLYLLPAQAGSKIDRAAIREYVRRDGEALLAAAKKGLNVHQLALDQKDIVDGHVVSLPPEQLDAFNRIYLEEMEASTKFMNSETEKALRKAEASTQPAGSVGKIGGVFIFICLIIILMAFLKK